MGDNDTATVRTITEYREAIASSVAAAPPAEPDALRHATI